MMQAYLHNGQDDCLFLTEADRGDFSVNTLFILTNIYIKQGYFTLVINSNVIKFLFGWSLTPFLHESFS